MSNNYEWKRLADLPHGLSQHRQATIGGFIYVFGGFKESSTWSNITNDLLRYSIKDNTWEIVDQPVTKPGARVDFAMCAIDGKLYIAGGGIQNGKLADLWEYTPESNTWVKKLTLGYGMSGDSIERNGAMLIFPYGKNSFLEYIPSTNTISEILPSFPNVNRYRAGLAKDNSDNILSYGGNLTNSIKMYVLKNDNTVDVLPDYPPGYYGNSLFHLDKFYTFGYYASASTRRFESFDITTGVWEDLSEGSPEPRGLGGLSDTQTGVVISGGRIDTVSPNMREVWFYGELEKPKGWKKLKNLPVKLDMHTQATISDDIYVFGGRVDGVGPVDTLYKYNIPSDTWTQIPKSGTWPTVKYGHVMVSINEKLYVTGGHNRNIYDRTTWEFDPSSNQWTAKKAMPVLKYQATAGVINDEMIVIGGSSGSTLQNTNFAYNPTNNTWRYYTPSQSFARLCPASAVVNDSLYLYGGSDASGAVQTFTLHVIENAIISKKEDHGPARWYHAGVKYKDSMYSLFGYTNQAQTIEAPCEEYNTLTETWTLVPDSPSKRRLTAASSVSNGFIVSGGSVVSGDYLDEVWFYGELEEPEKYSWKQKPDIPLQIGQVGTREGSQATIGTDVYLFGGLIKQTNNTFIDNDKLFKFDTILNEWSVVQPIGDSPSGRSSAIMVELNGKLYLHGGLRRAGDVVLNDMWEYDPILNKWTQKSNLVPLQKHYAFVQNGFIYMSGGSSSASASIGMNDLMYRFNPINQTLNIFPANNEYRRINATIAYDENSAYVYGGADYSPSYTRLNSGFVYSSEIISSIPNNYDTYGGTSTLLDGKLFVYGGNANNTFNSYNAQTGLWEEINEGYPPNRILSSYSDIQNGYIVVGGDFDLYGKEVWEYSLDGDIPEPEYEWKRVADIPVNSLYGHGQAIIGDNVYVFGGIKNGFGWQFTTNELWKYSISTDTWDIVTQLSTKPSARAYHIMVAINDKIYVYGSGVNGNVGDLWEYTPSTNTWVSKQGSPTGYSYKSTGVVANNKLVVFNNTGDIMIYDPTTDSWNGIPSYAGLSPSRLGVGSDGNNILLYGNEPSSSSCYVLRNLSTIEKLDDHAPTRSNNSLFFLSNKFYTFGGWPDSISDNRFESYNLATNTWENLSDIAPSNRRDYGVAVNQTQSFVTGGVIGANAPTNETWIFISREEPIPPDPEPEEWGYTEYTENTEVIVPERARYMRTVTVGSGHRGGGGLTAGIIPVVPGETLWLELNGQYSIVSAIRDGGKKVVIGAVSAGYNKSDSSISGGPKWSDSPFVSMGTFEYGIITSEYAGANGYAISHTNHCGSGNRTTVYRGGGAAGYNANGNETNTNGGRSGNSSSTTCVSGRAGGWGDGGGGVGLNGDVNSPVTPNIPRSGGSGGEDGGTYNASVDRGNGGKYGGGAGGGGGSGGWGIPGIGGISIKWLSNYDVDETFNDSKVSVSYDNNDEIIDYESSFDNSIIDISDFENPLSDNNNLKIDVSDYETPVGIYGNSGKITQVVKEKSRGRKVNHSTVDVSDHGDLQIRTNEAYLVVSDEHEGFTNVYNKSIVTLSDKGELQIKSNYMWAEVSFNGIKYSKEFRLRETTPNTVTLSPIYDVEYEFIGIYPSDDTYDCEVFVNGVLQEKGEGKYFKLLLGDTIQFRITSPNPGEVKFVAINGDNILNIICPSKYGNYPDFLDFGEFTETFPNFWYETGELVIDGLYPLDSYSEIYVNNVRVWMVINDGEPTNRVNVTNGDRIKLVFKGSSPTELPEGETYKIYHDNDRGTYDVGQVVVKSIVVEGSETRQDIKFFIDMIILKTVTERQQLLLDSDYNHYQRTNHDSKNDFVLDSQHGIHDQDVSYIWDYTSIYENEVDYVLDKTSIFENTPNEYIWDSTKIWENTPNEYIWDKTSIFENTPNEYIWDKTSIFESEEQSYDVNEYPSYIFDEYDTDVINSIRFPIGTDFGKNVSDIKFEIDTSGFIDNNKAQYHINNEYDIHTQIIQYEIDNVYETVSGKDGNIHINAVEWIRNVEDISVLIDHVYEYYDLGIHNLVDSVYENNTTISKIYIDAEYVHFSYSQYYFEGSYTHILQAVHIPIDAVYDRNQTERWPTEAQEWEAVKVQYPAYADMVYYHLVKYNPYHIIDTEFQIYIHTESKDVSGEYEEGTQHNNYKIDIVTDKGTSFVGYNFSGLYEKTEYNYHPVVTDKSLLVIGNSQTSVDGNDFEFVRDPVWQTDLIENLSGWHTREKAIEYAQSLNLSEEEIDLFEYEGRWGFTTDPELVVRDCSLPYPIIMIDKVIFWSH